jgi:predicted ester cyclase
MGEFLGFPASGNKATITGTSIQRIVDGKIVEGWDNWDQLGLLVQIGAVPAAHFVAPAAERRTA